MTLVNQLRQKLAEFEPSSAQQDVQITDADSGSAVNLMLVQRDALSCKAMELVLRRTAPVGADMRQWAQLIAGRVTSLLEPLQVLEVDTQRHRTLLRTTVNARPKDDVTYFEILLDGTTSATLRRWQAAMSQADTNAVRRTQVPFILTHEGLVKLVSDLMTA